MIFRLYRVLGLSLLVCMGALAATAQDPLTLRQAVDQAWVKVRGCHRSRRRSGSEVGGYNCAHPTAAPSQLHGRHLPRRRSGLCFGTRLRQGQFTQSDFALDALNHPQSIGNFATRFSGSWTAFDSFKTQREIHSADLLRASASSSAKAVDQQIVLNVVGAYQSVLYAQREIDVAEHEQETASALLASVDDHVKAGLAVESDRMSAQVNVAARKQN